MRDYSIEEERVGDIRCFVENFDKLQEVVSNCFEYVDSITDNYEILTALESIQCEIEKISNELEYTDEQRKIDYELDMEGL